MPSTKVVHSPRSLLVLPAQNSSGSILQLLLQELVYGERDGLAGRDAHYPRRDAFVEGVDTFLSVPRPPLLALSPPRGLKPTRGWDNGSLPEHIPCDVHNPTQRSLAGHSGCLLEACLDGVDGGVGEGAHRAGDEADDGRLVAGDGVVFVLRLPFLEGVFEFGVGGKIYGLVAAWRPGS